MARKNGRLGSFQIGVFILRNLGFMSFLGVLAALYIYNAHVSEYNVRQIQELKKEVQESRWLYMSLQSENMYNSLRSEVADRVREDGLRLHRGEPIVIRKQDEE